jgi:hypothetical protein
MSVDELAYTIKLSEIRTITWREGTKHVLRRQFAVLRTGRARVCTRAAGHDLLGRIMYGGLANEIARFTSSGVDPCAGRGPVGNRPAW